MKKIIYFAALLLTAFGISSCKDDAPESPAPSQAQATVQSGESEYTVIALMQPGNNDFWTASDMAHMVAMRATGEIDNSINVVGIIKPSPECQATSGVNYCLKFDLTKSNLSAAEINQLKNYTPYDLMPMGTSKAEYARSAQATGEVYKKVFACMKTSRFASASTDINNSDTIASLIRQAVREHPAKHYVFMLYGHGNGYSPVTDKASSKSYSTRACLPDENIPSPTGSDSQSFLTLDEFILGIEKSGVKFQTLLTQCCLMATLENMTAYSTQFDYFLGSDEQTMGDYFPQFIANFSGVAGDETRLKAGFKNTVDYYKTRCENMYKINKDYTTATSYGYYDLRKMSTLLATVKDATDWLTTANEKDSLYMLGVVNGAYYTLDTDPDSIVRNALKITSEQIDSHRDILQHPEKHTGITYDKLQQAFTTLLKFNETEQKYNFVFATILKAALDNKSTATASLDFARLQSIYDAYESTLKDMSYIRCSQRNLAAEQDPYIYASPSVQLVNFNKNTYQPQLAAPQSGFYVQGSASRRILDQLWSDYEAKDMKSFQRHLSEVSRGNYYASKYSYNKMIGDAEQMQNYTIESISRNYLSTQFSQKTGWGTLLSKTHYNPSMIFNPYRKVK